MNTYRNELTEFGNIVTWDTEFSGQEDGKLHIPHGKFEALGVLSGEDVYLYDNPDILPAVFERLFRCKMWILQNALYDLRQMSRFVPDILDRMPLVWDTEVVEHYIRTDYSSYNLDNLARRHLGIVVKKEMYEKLRNATFEDAALMEYLANDLVITNRVYKSQREYFKTDKEQLELYFMIDEPMISILSKMSLRGIRIDVERMIAWSEEVERKIEEYSKHISFNPRSPQQVKDYLFLKYRIKIKDTTLDTLETIREKFKDSEDLKALIEVKHLEKLRSTYGRTWIDKYVVNGEVHADVRVIGTETGRITYQNPNMQQIPARDFPIYREFVRAHDGMKLLVADISQQEPRLTAYISGEKHLQEYFVTGADIHLEVAKRIFKNPNLTKEKNKHERSIGKAINLGISYGLSAKGLSANVGIDLLDAEKIIDDYFREFPGIMNYITTQRSKASAFGFVQTKLGRKLYINPYNWTWKNTAINYPIQGSGADVLKLWMQNIAEKCKEQSLDFPLLMCIHDELVLEIPEGTEMEYVRILQEALDEVSVTLMPDAPYKFETEYEIGDSWACKK